MSEICPTSPYDKRNYRPLNASANGLKCDPYTIVINGGINRDGVTTPTAENAAPGADAVSSQVAGGAGCVSCG